MEEVITVDDFKNAIVSLLGKSNPSFYDLSDEQRDRVFERIKDNFFIPALTHLKDFPSNFNDTGSSPISKRQKRRLRGIIRRGKNRG